MYKYFEILIAILMIAVLGIVYPDILIWITILSIFGLLYLAWVYKSDGFKPQSKTYKAIEKLKKKREKKEHS